MQTLVYDDVLQVAREALKDVISETLNEGCDSDVSDEIFGDIMRTAFELCEVSRDEFAEALDLNTATLYRWTNETNMPQGFARPLILKKIVALMP